jgi:hypothetical protein
MKDHKLKVILFSTCDDTYEDIKIKSKDSAPGLSLMIFWTSKQFKAGVAEKTFANTLVNCWGCETVHSGAYVCGCIVYDSGAGSTITTLSYSIF